MTREHDPRAPRKTKGAVLGSRAVNVAILVLVVLELASGLGGFLIGEPEGRWVFWLQIEVSPEPAWAEPPLPLR